MLFRSRLWFIHGHASPTTPWQREHVITYRPCLLAAAADAVDGSSHQRGSAKEVITDEVAPIGRSRSCRRSSPLGSILRSRLSRFTASTRSPVGTFERVRSHANKLSFNRLIPTGQTGVSCGSKST